MPAFALSEPREEWLDGAGGRIFTRHWRPEGAPRAAITICHGVNSHGGQYYGAAQELVSRGYAVTALDLRGRGKSDGERFYVERVEDYVADLSLAVEWPDRTIRACRCSCWGTAPGASPRSPIRSIIRTASMA